MRGKKTILKRKDIDLLLSIMEAEEEDFSRSLYEKLSNLLEFSIQREPVDDEYKLTAEQVRQLITLCSDYPVARLLKKLNKLYIQISGKQ